MTSWGIPKAGGEVSSENEGSCICVNGGGVSIGFLPHLGTGLNRWGGASDCSFRDWCGVVGAFPKNGSFIKNCFEFGLFLVGLGEDVCCLTWGEWGICDEVDGVGGLHAEWMRQGCLILCSNGDVLIFVSHTSESVRLIVCHL